MSKCTNKHIYNKLIENYIEQPTAIGRLLNTFPFLEKKDWSLIFKRTFEITQEPYLQSFQYNIINRILNTREKLNKWKIADGVEHHLFYFQVRTLLCKRLKE